MSKKDKSCQNSHSNTTLEDYPIAIEDLSPTSYGLKIYNIYCEYIMSKEAGNENFYHFLLAVTKYDQYRPDLLIKQADQFALGGGSCMPTAEDYWLRTVLAQPFNSRLTQQIFRRLFYAGYGSTKKISMELKTNSCDAERKLIFYRLAALDSPAYYYKIILKEAHELLENNISGHALRYYDIVRNLQPDNKELIEEISSRLRSSIQYFDNFSLPDKYEEKLTDLPYAPYLMNYNKYFKNGYYYMALNAARDAVTENIAVCGIDNRGEQTIVEGFTRMEQIKRIYLTVFYEAQKFLLFANESPQDNYSLARDYFSFAGMLRPSQYISEKILELDAKIVPLKFNLKLETGIESFESMRTVLREPGETIAEPKNSLSLLRKSSKVISESKSSLTLPNPGEIGSLDSESTFSDFDLNFFSCSVKDTPIQIPETKPTPLDLSDFDSLDSTKSDSEAAFQQGLETGYFDNYLKLTIGEDVSKMKIADFSPLKFGFNKNNPDELEWTDQSDYLAILNNSKIYGLYDAFTKAYHSSDCCFDEYIKKMVDGDLSKLTDAHFAADKFGLGESSTLPQWKKESRYNMILDKSKIYQNYIGKKKKKRKANTAPMDEEKHSKKQQNDGSLSNRSDPKLPSTDLPSTDQPPDLNQLLKSKPALGHAINIFQTKISSNRQFIDNFENYLQDTTAILQGLEPVIKIFTNAADIPEMVWKKLHEICVTQKIGVLKLMKCLDEILFSYKVPDKILVCLCTNQNSRDWMAKNHEKNNLLSMFNGTVAKCKESNSREENIDILKKAINQVKLLATLNNFEQELQRPILKDMLNHPQLSLSLPLSELALEVAGSLEFDPEDIKIARNNIKERHQQKPMMFWDIMNSIISEESKKNPAKSVAKEQKTLGSLLRGSNNLFSPMKSLSLIDKPQPSIKRLLLSTDAPSSNSSSSSGIEKGGLFNRSLAFPNKSSSNSIIP